MRIRPRASLFSGGNVVVGSIARAQAIATSLQAQGLIIQHPANELRRTPLPRRWVNRGKNGEGIEAMRPRSLLCALGRPELLVLCRALVRLESVYRGRIVLRNRKNRLRVVLRMAL